MTLFPAAEQFVCDKWYRNMSLAANWPLTSSLQIPDRGGSGLVPGWRQQEQTLQVLNPHMGLILPPQLLSQLRILVDEFLVIFLWRIYEGNVILPLRSACMCLLWQRITLLSFLLHSHLFDSECSLPLGYFLFLKVQNTSLVWSKHQEDVFGHLRCLD